MTNLTTHIGEPELLTQHLDATVSEVFGMMLGLECTASMEPAPKGTESLTAVIGLAGTLRGAFLFRSSREVAVRVAGALLGMPCDTLDPSVKDAVGELSNMLAGAWKNRFPQFAATCALSVPTVVSGSDYRLYMFNPAIKIERDYAFENFAFHLTILGEILPNV